MNNIKSALLFIPGIILLVYFCAGLFYDADLVIYIKPLIVPTFLIYAIANNYKILTRNYYLFVLFFYINEVLILFWADSVHIFIAALIASLFCYLCLIILGYRSIKPVKIFTVPKGFTLFIFGLNAIFLIAIVALLLSVINDSYIDIILIFNALISVFLGITAVLYLSKFGSQKAYYYFFGAFALIFNDVFAAIGTYVVDNVVLNTFDRTLHFTSFFLIYLFVISDKKKVENLLTDSQP